MSEAPPGPENDDNRVVLIVDDRRSFRHELARAIRRETRLTPLEAPDGLHALEILGRRDDVRLVCADEVMDVGPSGTMLLEEVGRRWPQIRRMLLSGYTTSDMAGAASYPVVDKAVSWWIVIGLIETLANERDDP